MQPKLIAKAALQAAEDKKAEDPVILNVSKLTSIAHYFLITHGNSDRQVVAIANNIIDELKKKNLKCFHVEGLEAGKWVLLDFGPLLVHVFYKDVRSFYGLERLWGEAPVVK